MTQSVEPPKNGASDLTLDSLKSGLYLTLTRLRLRAGFVYPLLCLFLGNFRPAQFSVGLTLILIGYLLRLYSSAFISKGIALTTSGPYSLCRNPLYLGTILIQVGFGFLSGSYILTLIGFVFFCFLYVRVILEEERWLLRRFGEDFRSYLKRSPRLFPTPISFLNAFSLRGFSFGSLTQNRELVNGIAVIGGVSVFLVKYAFSLWQVPINLW